MKKRSLGLILLALSLNSCALVSGSSVVSVYALKSTCSDSLTASYEDHLIEKILERIDYDEVR